MNTYGIKGTDNFEITFSDTNSLLDELDFREAATQRITISTDEIEIFTKEEMMDKLHMTPAIPEAIEESRLFMKIEEHIYPISINSFISIKGRIDLQGKGLFDLSDATLKTVVDELLKKHAKVMVVVIDEKVHAVFSANTGGYKPIPSPELVGTAFDALEGRIDAFEFKSAHMSYDLLEVNVAFPTKAEVLQNLYGKEENAIPGVVIRTSETGFNSSVISPTWDIDGHSVVFDDEAIRMVHRGKDASIEVIAEEIPFVFSKMRKTIALIKKQMAYSVKYPDLLLEAIFEKMKIAKKDSKNIMARYQTFMLTNMGKSLNGYEIVKFFIEYSGELEGDKKTSFESTVGKIFNLNFERIENNI